ncbi:hypothetical protein E2C01_058884 [Portunus trituberculatus]|uniref:Uncharacterized protein n=1 Tax=Portunus trituberculatus TaxID=210409 RepID=A0A5B7H3Y2_PORTR|nr:hypothetical protein [Portunus trituberculatus]
MVHRCGFLSVSGIVKKHSFPHASVQRLHDSATPVSLQASVQATPHRSLSGQCTPRPHTTIHSLE